MNTTLGTEAMESRKVSADMFFIKGNHEDFEFLENLSSSDGTPVAVDHYGKMFFLKSGSVYHINVSGYELNIGVLGGIASEDREITSPASCFHTKSEFRKLRSAGEKIDILLTHDVPLGRVFNENTGSKEILELIRELQPCYQFCGHYHIEGHQLKVPGKTKSFLLNEVNFHKPIKLNQNCFGILKWSRCEGAKFNFVDESWLNEYTHMTFRQL